MSLEHEWHWVRADNGDWRRAWNCCNGSYDQDDLGHDVYCPQRKDL